MSITVKESFISKLTVVDDLGKSNQSEVTITVNLTSPPVSNFTATSDSGLSDIPTVVTLDGSSSSPGAGGGTITSYEWSLSDGTTLNGQVISHTFTVPGDYVISLKITNSNGDSNTKSINKTYFPPFAIGVTANRKVYAVGHTIGFNGFVRDNTGTNISQDISWESSDPSILEKVSGSVFSRKISGRCLCDSYGG